MPVYLTNFQGSFYSYSHYIPSHHRSTGTTDANYCALYGFWAFKFRASCFWSKNFYSPSYLLVIRVTFKHSILVFLTVSPCAHRMKYSSLHRPTWLALYLCHSLPSYSSLITLVWVQIFPWLVPFSIQISEETWPLLWPFFIKGLFPTATICCLIFHHKDCPYLTFCEPKNFFCILEYKKHNQKAFYLSKLIVHLFSRCCDKMLQQKQLKWGRFIWLIQSWRGSHSNRILRDPVMVSPQPTAEGHEWMCAH